MNLREAIRASLALLDRRDRRLLGVSVGVQMATSILDLVGVLLLGVLGTVSAAGFTGRPLPDGVRNLAIAVGLGDSSDATILAWIAGAAATVLLAKSVLSPLLMLRVFKFLAGREAYVSARLAKELFSRPLSFAQQRSSQTTAFALCQSASVATVTALGQMVVAASEAALLTVLSVTLLFVSPVVAIVTVTYFAMIAFGLQRFTGNKAAKFGAQRSDLDVQSWTVIQEVLGAYREITVADRRTFFVHRLRGLRDQAARAAAGLQMIALTPKYALEGALVFGAFGLGAVLFATQSATTAVGTLALFLGAATRAMPSLMRLQSSILAIRGAAGGASPTFELAADLGCPRGPIPSGEMDEARRRVKRIGHADFVPSVEVLDVELTYPGSDSPAVQGISLNIGKGQSVALIGRSGAGKSTLADILLGVLEPDSGVVRLGGERPADAIHRWPGGIAYVPQEVMLADDSIRANVALGLPSDLIDDDLVWDALVRADIADYVRAQPDGLDSYVGERGLRLSGGQRQRLGIARAIFTQPRLLVLDEATSALDAETEQAITAMLRELAEDVTTVIIAHRLSTVRHVDLVVYLEEGRPMAMGSFDEVCECIPALQRQAALMGLAAPDES